MSTGVLLAVSAETISLTRNYPSAVYVTTVLYDYLLNFSREITFGPWSWVSTLFVLVRYIGISWVVLDMIFVSFDVNTNPTMYGPNVARLPKELLTFFHRCIATCLIALWEYPLFLAASDFVMILRVYALWGRSKPILYSLLFIYVSQLVTLFVFLGLYGNPNAYFTVKSGQDLKFPQCTVTFHNTPTTLGMYIAIPRFVFCVMLLVLALVRTVKESSEMYKVTEKWQPNRYVQQSVRDGIIYFVTISAWNVIQLLPSPKAGLAWDLFFTIGFRIVCCMMPLFIINVREQYARNLNCQDIDTGFGVSSQLTSTGSLATSEITFADYSPGWDQEKAEDDGDDSGSSARDVEA